MNTHSDQSDACYDYARANAQKVIAQYQADMDFMSVVSAAGSDAVVARRAGISESDVTYRVERILETGSLPFYVAQHFLGHHAGTALSCVCEDMLDLVSIDYEICGPALSEALHRQGLISSRMLARLRSS